jgi:hypothetical protein
LWKTQAAGVLSNEQAKPCSGLEFQSQPFNSEPIMLDKPHGEKHRSRRAKMARTLRVRPSEPRDEHFDDLTTSANASKEGIYFTTRRSDYYPGMRAFVTCPYSSPHDPMNREYVAQVMRVDKLPNGKFGVAVELLMTL